MTGLLNGLNEEEVRRSREEHGDNALGVEKHRSVFRKFLENLADPIIKVLLIALLCEIILTLGRCDWFEIGGIVVAILIATVVSTLSEYGSERAFEKMQQDSMGGGARVLRNGKVVFLPSAEIVVGDIIFVSAGEKICADGVMVKGEISVDQSALNGEGHEVTKHCSGSQGYSLDSDNRVFRGSVITGGDGVMCAERVGGFTYYGMVARDVQAETRVSPLKLRLTTLAKQISRIGYIIAALVALTYIFNAVVADNYYSASAILQTLRDPRRMFSILLHAFTLMITVVVVAVPEGLPMMITVVLSANMKKMLRDNVLVKKLVGIETAGSLNILFTDKTGTITAGKMECDRFVTADGEFKNPTALRKNPRIYALTLLSAKCNTDCMNGDGEPVGGNATDRAISKAFFEEKSPPYRITQKESFNSERKYSAVTVRTDKAWRLIKGAPEYILKKCLYQYNAQGNAILINRASLEALYLSCAAKGERVIAIAAAEGDADYSFVTFVVLKDRIRSGTREAVRRITRAGVKVVMITGDNRDTATHIAEECGIYKPSEGNICIDCEELHKMSDSEVKALLPDVRVVSRALPQDKTRLVRLSQEMGLVAGMTGDGINDAPSLKLSDVGFAMGSGTDIAKSAGDVVILDNSISAIGNTILYGRTIFKSIRKFITFQLIMNLAACGISLIGQFVGVENPITIVQMLWVNIIMDTLGGLAFSGEPALEYYMAEKPKKRDEPILTRGMMKRILLSGGYTLTLCMMFLKLDFFHEIFRDGEGDKYFLTAFYALFIFAGIFNCFACRSERLWIFSNIGKNKPFLIIMLLIAVIQTLMIYYGGALFRSVPLTAHELFSVVLIASTVLVFDIIRRIAEKLH